MSHEQTSYTTVNRNEYERLQSRARRADNIEANVRDRMERISRDLNAQMNSNMNQVNRRFSNYEDALSGLSQDIREFERQQNQRLKAESEKFQRGLNDLQGQLNNQRGEYTRLIREQGEALSRAMEAQRQNLQSQINNISSNLAAKEANEQDLANRWLADISKLLDVIDREYRHNKFKPGALEQLQREISLSRSNIANGVNQAAISSCQQTYLRASELRIELERLEHEWQLYLQAARSKAAEALAFSDAQQSCAFMIEAEEGASEVRCEVDHWTEGGLTRLLEKINAETSQLARPDAMTLDNLKQSIGRSEQALTECEGLVATAKDALLASQIRHNMGEIIADALESQGWSVVDATYASEDFRRGKHIKFENRSGDEIVTVITPEASPNHPVRNRLDIAFFDRSTNDESNRQARLQSVMESISQEGFECEKPRCKEGTEHNPCADNTLLDFERVRRQAATQTATR